MALTLFRGRIKVMSTILRDIRRWVSRKPLEMLETCFQRTTKRKWPTGNQMVTWPMTSQTLGPRDDWFSAVRPHKGR